MDFILQSLCCLFNLQYVIKLLLLNCLYSDATNIAYILWCKPFSPHPLDPPLHIKSYEYFVLIKDGIRWPTGYLLLALQSQYYLSFKIALFLVK